MVRPRHELRALLVLVVLTVQAPVSAPLDCKNSQCERIDGLHSADLSSLLLRRERPDVHVDPGVLSGRLWPGRGGEQFWLSHNTYRPQPFLPPRRAAIFQWLDSRKGHRPTSKSAEHSLDQPGLDMTISRGRPEQHSLDRGTQRGRSMNKPSGRNLFSKVLPVEVQQRGERRMLQDKTHAPIKGSLLDLLLQGIGEHTRGDVRGEEQEVGRWEGAEAGSENVHSVSENRALPGLQKGNLPQKNTALSIPPAIGEEVHGSRHAPSSALVEVGRGYGGAKREGFMVKNRDSGLRSVKKTEQAMQSSKLEKRDSDYGYIITDKTPLRLHEAWQLLGALGHAAGLSYTSFTDVSVTESVITFRIQQNPLNLSLADIADHAVLWRTSLHRATGIRILQVGVGQHAITMGLAQPGHRDGGIRPALILALCVLLALAVVSGTAVVFFTRSRASWKRRADYTSLDTEPGTDPPADYQELCRQRMASQSSEPERDRAPSVPHVSRISSLSSQPSEGAPYPHSPSPRSSISSWTEEPATSNLDITTGHMILAYMEDHVRNRHRLQREWEALCMYQAEPCSCTIAQNLQNVFKNRTPIIVPYDHARVVLNSDVNASASDYINASLITDHDPRTPAYIAAQSPMAHTISDFWQMVWENRCVVLVMLCPSGDEGKDCCPRYWPTEGSAIYHKYEVHLVSEHVCCEEYVVRSLYLKHMLTGETRTVTQFHFLRWAPKDVPSAPYTLLEFRRKVNKCFRGRSCPIIVHCSDGSGHSGTYILLDMVLNRVAKGTKEIDIAATLEFIRDQRPKMVETKEQFAFCLTAVAEEVNSILKSLPK